MKSRPNVFVAALVLACSGPAMASVQVDVTFTGDNVARGFLQNGTDVQEFTLGSSNRFNWKKADTVSLNLLPSESYQIVFNVLNVGEPNSGNPAALLAQITGDMLGGPISTSSSWQIAAYDPNVQVTDFNASTWSDAIPAMGGTNYPQSFNGGHNIWKNNSGAAIAGISSSADWIWDGTTGSQTTSGLWLRTTIETVPEPGSILVWSLIGLTVLGGVYWRRRK